MPRIRRRDLPDGYFHVTARGVSGDKIFLADLDRFDFLELLERIRRRHRLRIVARCLMDTHYHLVVEAPTVVLSAAMQQLNSAYGQRFNRRHDRRGHVFAEKFRSWVIRDEAHLHAALQYVTDNPAKAGPSADRDTRWTLIDADQLRS